MEKVRAGFAAKITALFLFTAGVITAAGSFAAIAALDHAGFYQNSPEETLEEGMARVADHYAVLALADYQGDFARTELERTNFRYGVVQAEDLDEVDLSDASSYLVENLGSRKDPDDLYVFESSICESTDFVTGRNFWDSFAVNENEEPQYITKEYQLDGCIYDRDTELLYLRCGRKLFLAGGFFVWTKDDDVMPEDMLDNTFLVQEETAEGSSAAAYEWDPIFSLLELADKKTLDMEDVEITDSAGLAEAGTVYEHAVLDHVENDTVYVLEKQEPESVHYYVLSYVQKPLAGERSFWEGDMFVQLELFVNTAYRMRYPLIGILAASLFVLAAAFAFLMSSAGWRRGAQKVTPAFLDRLPLDIYLAGIIALEVICMSVSAQFLVQGANQLRYGGGFVSCVITAVCAAALGILLAAGFCMSAAVHIKLGKWHRHTFIYWFGRKCLSCLRACVRYCLFLIKTLWNSFTLLWKAWLILGFLALVEFFVLTMYADYETFTELTRFWLLEKLILYPLIIFLLLQMDKLQKGARKIAGGGLDFRIHTDRMFWEMKKHGEYLNDIGTGMNRAVNERLKSEHFKTELITNVSHDIKTPLTSIINYVDLLQKERIDNPTAQEYLDVLCRQSARLKKLIEDLMEASKASTGNLSVVMEKCDTSVMLIQTVGEFEEKLMENQVELQIKKPEESIFIEADSRHLWRVFDNLMNNICKYAQPTTRAYVNLEQDGQQALIIFRNISKCQLNISSEELMERFVRGDSSRNTEGSGLGISIAKSLTELMKGTFELVVDGDLFKVVLSFPLYGVPKLHKINVEEKENKEKEVQMRPSVLEGLAAGVQNAGSCAADIGRSAADRAGLVLRRAGRFVYHMKEAAAQTREEEAQAGRTAEPSDKAGGGQNKL